MKNFFIVLVFLAVGFIGYSIGYKRAYNLGYETGYAYDCREEIKDLKRTVDALTKAAHFAKEMNAAIMSENQNLRGRTSFYQRFPNFIQDSIRNQPKIDSLKKATGKNYYTVGDGSIHEETREERDFLKNLGKGEK